MRPSPPPDPKASFPLGDTTAKLQLPTGRQPPETPRPSITKLGWNSLPHTTPHQPPSTTIINHALCTPLPLRQPAAIPAMPAAPAHRTQRSHTRPWFKSRSSFSPPELVDAGVWASQRSRPSRGYCPRLTQRMLRPSPSPTGYRPSILSRRSRGGGGTPKDE